jgi:RNA polymerase sigma-70 factor (ECF subfamily)
MCAAAVQPVMTTPTARRGAVDETEHRWIERARAGDEDAFRMLMNDHRDRALGIALRITRSREDAEEVVQQSFVRAWFALNRFREESTFGTWLHRIVVRRALDCASRMKGRREDTLDAAIDVFAPAGHERRDVILIRRLEGLMASLPPAQRAAVTLFYWEEMQVEEIACVMGVPENTVETHLSRARAALRQAWLRMEARR